LTLRKFLIKISKSKTGGYLEIFRLSYKFPQYFTKLGKKDKIMANTQKKDIVSSVQSAIEGGKNFALIQFEKTTHKDLEGIKKDLLKKDAKIKVIKNTLFEKAVNILSEKNSSFKSISKSFFPLKARSALLTFNSDWSDALKAFYTKIKGSESFSFKFGLIENTPYDAKGMNALATLPGKTELMGKLIGTMKNPMARTVATIKNPMQKFVYVLSAKAKQG
jgi:large subunit ribosomal protein L10